MRRLPLVLSCLWLLPLAAVRAGEPEDLAPLLEPLRAKHELPALGGAIVTPAGVVALGACGVRKHGDPTPVTVEDQWHLGSCTKAMTATLLALWVERRQLRWDMPLTQCFPDLGARLHRDFRRVTLFQLLAHQGGLAKDATPEQWQALWRSGDVMVRRQELAASILTAAPAYPPGSRAEYSNQNYILAGAVLERLAGEPWETLIQQQLFAPLGMQHAGFGPPGRLGSVEQPWGHKVKDGVLVAGQGDNPPGLGPAGTVHCTLRDWAEFVRFHLTRGDRRLRLSRKQLDRLHTPRDRELSDYAGGWGVPLRDWGGGAVLTHNGSNTLNFCVTWVAPERGFAVLVTTNLGGTTLGGVPLGAACDEVVAQLIGKARQP